MQSLGTSTTVQSSRSCDRWGTRTQFNMGSFTSLDFDVALRSCCVDSPSPQVSTIQSACFTVKNYRLRDSPQNFRQNGAGKCSQKLPDLTHANNTQPPRAVAQGSSQPST